MKSLNSSRCALSICIAAAILAGCSGFQPSSITSGVNALAPASHTTPTNGGAFSGSYSGRYSISGSCIVAASEHFRFHGTGRANFLRQSTEHGHLKLEGQAGDCIGWNGVATLTSSDNPKNTVTVSISGGSFGDGTPCYLSSVFTVTSGTGKFINATGGGSIKFQCLSGYAYSDQWSGTLYY